MAKTPPTALTILKVRRTRKHVVIHYRNGENDHNIKCRDNPLPAFDKAVSALAPLVIELLHLPSAYIENLKATGITISDASGNDQVCVVAQKSLVDAAAPFNICTPLRLMDLPEKPGSVSTPPLTDAQVELVDEVVEQAKAYIKGDRAQGQIAFDDGEKGADDGSGEVAPAGEELPFPGGSTGTPAKKTKKKRGVITGGRAAAR
jgi:hypothetical protein